MTRFRPCIDLHAGAVKQIVGGTLTSNAAELKTNFTSAHPAAYFADLYRRNNVHGGHVIMLGPGSDTEATQALNTWPGKLQIGGGVNDTNAAKWLRAGAEKVIITSFLFPSSKFSMTALRSVLAGLNEDRSKLVIDLSCRRVGDEWRVATNKWQTVTDFAINRDNIAMLEPYCSEFLIHAADAEGLQAGIDEQLVVKLAEFCTIPVTYAGGGRTLEDLELVERLSHGKVDLTIGSALDIFGGEGVTFEECCQWNRNRDGL